MILTVREWIQEGCFYPVGVMMLRDYGGDVIDLEKYTAASATTTARERLRERLIAFIHLPPPKRKTAPEKQGETPQPIAEPAEIFRLRATAKTLHKREAAVHAQMRLATERAERYQCAREIMVDIRPELDEIYQKIGDFKTSGLVP